jgi:hypothetical protein
MKIAFDGGKCCGIKIIHGLSFYPTEEFEAVAKKPAKNPDRFGTDVSSSMNAFYKEAPIETGEERLDRYLDFLKDWRPNGIIQITLADYQMAWEPVIKERGFKLVSPESGVLNSNSMRKIFVYHKYT